MIKEGGAQLVEFCTDGTDFEWILNLVTSAPRGGGRVKETHRRV